MCATNVSRGHFVKNAHKDIMVVNARHVLRIKKEECALEEDSVIKEPMARVLAYVLKSIILLKRAALHR